MKIAVVGGGPAALYFAILMKRTYPAISITTYERNRPDDTFGFGVVFSDQTLDNFEKADAESYRAITENFAYWDDIEIHFRGKVRRIGGNGFCGCSRVTLLRILQERARRLGVDMVFQTEVDPGLTQLADCDLVVAADGVNSRVREANREHFGTKIDLRPNHFTWMGSTRPFDAFSFFFRETEFGIFIAHCYQYEPGHSTWVLEVQHETFLKAGLDKMSEEQSARFLETVFAEELQGHPLLINRSMWRQFPRITNERWVKDNVVIVGDAKATAHWSIGSGTKLAMEDSIALFETIRDSNLDIRTALRTYEADRRTEVEKTQHAADVSLVWFEHIDRFIDMDPVRFSFGLMTRSKAITWDNLALRAPEFVDDVGRMFAHEVRAEGHDVDADTPHPPMFQPLNLRGLTLSNRIVMSPMDQYSAVDGVPTDWHLVHYGSRGLGGAGLMFTEMVCVSPEGRITPGCSGIYNDAQETAWARIVDFVHANSATKICLQLGHSGRKGATRLMWEGMDEPLRSGGWDVISASPLPYYAHSPVPREMTRADMDAVARDFVACVRRAERAGFDMIELHCAHGYLLASFISPLTNTRTDGYGGNLENRLKFPLEVFRAIRAEWPADKPMSVRISATDWKEGGTTSADSVEIARAFAREGVDLVDASTGQTVPDGRPIFGRMFQTPFADAIRNEAMVRTMCVGAITSADQANTILAAGRADLVALGRPHLVDPFFTLRAAAWYGADTVGAPPQYAPGRDQAFRNSLRERQDLLDLRQRGRPKSRAELNIPRRSAAE
jgi:anthraniloyl-CoA monooxygenase